MVCPNEKRSFQPRAGTRIAHRPTFNATLVKDAYFCDTVSRSFFTFFRRILFRRIPPTEGRQGQRGGGGGFSFRIVFDEMQLKKNQRAVATR